MTQTLNPKVLVLGGGPGGYVAAIRAGQLGLDTVLVDAERLGGTCLIRGCIPSKALIHAASQYAAVRQCAGGSELGISVPEPELDFAKTIAWKEGIVDKLNGGVAALLKRAKVKVIHGFGRFSDAKTLHVASNAGPVVIAPEHVILATGSVPVELASLPFGGKVISSAEALALGQVPDRLVVVGGGYIGLELGTAYAKLGARVTIVEAAERILPQYDPNLTKPVSTWLQQHGVTVLTRAKAIGQEGDGLAIEDVEGERTLLRADRILITVGRAPNIADWGLEETGAAMNGRFVKVDDRCATSVTNVWAIGDLVGEPMLAHKASAQGEMVAEIISGKRRKFDPIAIAAVCFTEPEIVTVGMAPHEVPDGMEIVTGQFPFQGNGRALSMEAGDAGGFVRVIARQSDHRVLGLSAVGEHVSELAGEFATLVEMGAVLEDVAGTIHVHPTLGEAVHESALKALGHAIHI